MVTTLHNLLERLGPRKEASNRQEESHHSVHEDRVEYQEHEREHSCSPCKRENVMIDHDVVVAGHMSDILRTRPPTFDGPGSGLEVETWLLDMGR